MGITDWVHACARLYKLGFIFFLLPPGPEVLLLLFPCLLAKLSDYYYLQLGWVWILTVLQKGCSNRLGRLIKKP